MFKNEQKGLNVRLGAVLVQIIRQLVTVETGTKGNPKFKQNARKANMSKEYFWGCELNETNREYTWDPEIDIQDQSEEDCYENHALILKSAMIGGTDSAVDGEINIVELETEGYLSAEVKQPILRLKCGTVDHISLDVYIPKCGILRLISGSGPVHISGQHIIEYTNDEDEGDDTKLGVVEDDEEEDEEEEEVEPEPIVEKGKRKLENGKGKPNKVAKLDDREEEYSDPESPPKNSKKKTILKGKAKAEQPTKKSKK
uniref:Nucleoplasmin core domain-containing protein n=1 Tax=Strigamia maritima TaxID=126957 RepID=T1IQI8_STRMM